MKVFLTGATGYIGSAVAAALLDGGHRVTGLVRDPAKARELERRGLTLVRGALSEVGLLADQAEKHDAVIHAASDGTPKRAEIEAAALEALALGARGGAKAFV